MIGIVVLMVVVMLAQSVVNADVDIPVCPTTFISPPYASYSCYLFSSKEHTCDKADRRCKRFDLIPGYEFSLVRIETELEDNWLTAQTANRVGNRWIWLRRYNGDDWHWQDCLSEYVIKGGATTEHYSNFIEGEPNNHKNHSEDCASKVRKANGKWNDFPPSNTQKFICEGRPIVIVNVLQIWDPINPRLLDVQDVCYGGGGIGCEYGPDYGIVAGELVVFSLGCLGKFKLYYL